jgi:hypothetical protein
MHASLCVCVPGVSWGFTSIWLDAVPMNQTRSGEVLGWYLRRGYQQAPAAATGLQALVFKLGMLLRPNRLLLCKSLEASDAGLKEYHSTMNDGTYV